MGHIRKRRGHRICSLYRQNTFNDWFRKAQTERRIASAEKILTAVYKVNDAFEAIRSPLLEGYELENAEKRLKETGEFAYAAPAKFKQATIAQLILTRMAGQGQTFKELYECLPMARAAFGKDLHDKLRGLLQARRNIEVAAQMYATTERDDNTKDFLNGCERTMGTMPRPEIEDKVGMLIAAALTLSEELCLPAISGEAIKRNKKKGA